MTCFNKYHAIFIKIEQAQINKINLILPHLDERLKRIYLVSEEKFLPWIAAQNFVGPINLASEGMITMQMLLDYIEKKVGKKALIDTENGTDSPFNENTFSQNMDKAKRLGWNTSNIHDWFWKLMDEYITRALQ